MSQEPNTFPQEMPETASAISRADDVPGCSRARLHWPQITVDGPLPHLERNDGCALCTLAANPVTTRCVGARPYRVSGHRTALYVIGEAPGHTEDEYGLPFVGPSGIILSWMYLSAGEIRPALAELRIGGVRNAGGIADIYIGNAVRCRPVANATPTVAQRNACRLYWRADLRELARHYRAVVVLCVGATATQSVLRLSLAEALRHQGTPIEVPDGPTVRVFSTYHPAVLLRHRSPSLADSVLEHLRVLVAHLRGDRAYRLTAGLPPPHPAPEVPSFPDGPPALWALDTETYGALLTMPDQHYFHPIKCRAHDGAPPGLVRTICVAYRDPTTRRLVSAVFVPTNPTHMARFWAWVSYFTDNSVPCCGMNLKFDLLMLRHQFPLNGPRRLNHNTLELRDISTYNYLHNELRPERSLKDLARLFHVSAYDRTLADGKFLDDDDPALHAYCALDCCASLEVLEVLERRIREDYGPDTEKLSPYSRRWFSDLIWYTLYMSEDGVAVSEPKIRDILASSEATMTRSAQEFQRLTDGPLFGAGSRAHIQSIFDTSMDALCRRVDSDTTRYTYTDKTGTLSTGRANLERFLLDLPPDSTLRLPLRLVEVYRTAAKLHNTYVVPLLGLRTSGKAPMASAIINGIVYPDWYPTPGPVKDEYGDSGGTIQCRITCKNPPLQTDPPAIKEAIWPRRPGDYLLVADSSQIELRTAGLLSNEPHFMDAYAHNRDLHRETALLLFGEDLMAGDSSDAYRQAAKRTNFLMLFRGGADTLSLRIMEDVGIYIPVRVCEGLISTYYSRYRRLNSWQLDLIAEAVRTQYISLPLTGASRLFIGDARTIKATYTNTICNIPVQAIAAKIMSDAHKNIVFHIKDHNLPAWSGLQIYDSIFVESSPTHLDEMKALIETHMLCPPFYQALCARLGRTMPLGVSVKIFRRVNSHLEPVETYGINCKA